jgi:hypothetical protein
MNGSARRNTASASAPSTTARTIAAPAIRYIATFTTPPETPILLSASISGAKKISACK